jgi:hypothetical protein
MTELQKNDDEASDGGLPAVDGSPSLDSLKGLKGIEYRKAWNKLHKERMNECSKEYRSRNASWIYKKRHSRFIREKGASMTTIRSRESESKATMAFERWGPVEDNLLMCGEYTESQLVEMLGRSIRAIERRKWRLRQVDSSENA